MLLMLLGYTTYSNAQNITIDSTAYISIVKLLQERGASGEGQISIKQSNDITMLLEGHALTNQKNQQLQGWRIRIYRDNAQTARQRSESIKNTFVERFPNMGAYQTYKSPYFVVTVGDFRSTDDAEKFMRKLKTDYPGDYSNSWIISEKINFPPLL